MTKYFFFKVSDDDEYNINAERGCVDVSEELQMTILKLQTVAEALAKTGCEDVSISVRDNAPFLYETDTLLERGVSIIKLVNTEFEGCILKETFEQILQDEDDYKSLELCHLIVTPSTFSWRGTYDNGIVDFETADIDIKLLEQYEQQIKS